MTRKAWTSRRSQSLAAAWAISCVLLALPGIVRADDETGSPYVGRSLEEALADLRADGLKVIYSSDLVTAEMRVEQPPQSRTHRELLDELLRPHGLSVRKGPGGTLLVVQDTGEPLGGWIRGVVRHTETHERLPGARVALLDAATRTVTDSDGRFAIADVDPGSYGIEVRLPGFVLQRMTRIRVDAGNMVEVTVDLTPAPVTLERVAVTPSHYDLREDPEGRRYLSPEEIDQVPRLGDDVNRAVSRLPGVIGGDLSSTLNIRGGEDEEILFVLDGLEIDEPFHLNEMFSIVDSNTIGGVELMTGAFPAEYGDRMSGVIDTFSTTARGAPRTSVGLSTTHAHLRNQGTFGGDQGQWLISGRQGYSDYILEFLDNDTPFGPTSYDVFGKLQYRLSSNTTATANVLAAYDGIRYNDDSGAKTERDDTKSGIAYGWINLKTAWTPRLFSQTVLSYGTSEWDREAGRLDAERSLAVRDYRTNSTIGLKQDWTFRASARHLVKGGFDFKGHDAFYDYRRSSQGEEGLSAAEIAVGLRPDGDEIAAYLSDRIRVIEPLTLEVGVRWDRQSYTDIDDDDQFSPRVNVAWVQGPNMFRAGWGRFYQSQGIHELQVEDGVSEFFPAQYSEHLVVGFDRAFENGLQLRTEVYRKDMDDLRPRYENLFDPFGLFPEAGGDRVRIEPERATAEGVEVGLRRRGDKVSWWGSYTLASAEDVVDGEHVPRSWDRRHAFNFGVNYRHGLYWNLTFAGQYFSGAPTTDVTAETIDNPDGSTSIVPVLGPRNAERLPAYHRFDVRASRRIPVKQGQLRVFVEVLNLFDHDNPCCVNEFVFVPRPDGSVAVKEKYDNWLPRLPSFGITWEF